MIIFSLTFLIPGGKNLFVRSFSDGYKMFSNISIVKKFLPNTNVEEEDTNSNYIKTSEEINSSNENIEDSKDITIIDNNSSDFNDDSLEHREEFAAISNRIAKNNMWIGVGFGAYMQYMNSEEFDLIYPQYNLTKTHPHSSFVLLFSEVSVLSLFFIILFFVSIIFRILGIIIRNSKNKDDIYIISVILFSIVTGFLVVNSVAENAIYDTQIYPLFMIILGLLLNKCGSIKEKKTIMFISSTGGHLSEMMQLKKMFKKYDYYIITEKTDSNLSLEKKYPQKIKFLIYGSKSHCFKYPFKLLGNCFKSLYLYIKIKPDIIITTGTHTAGPMCCIGKIFGSKIIYIETFANINTKTATGKIIYLFADLFIVQWENMVKLYPKAEYWGWIY